MDERRAIASCCYSQRAVEPSMSVNRKVSVPMGREGKVVETSGIHQWVS